MGHFEKNGRIREKMKALNQKWPNLRKWPNLTNKWNRLMPNENF
jgi:hypothetical protein